MCFSINNIFFKTYDHLTAFRLRIKINTFRSPMNELSSLRYSLHHLKSRIIFRFKNKQFKLKKNQFAEKFKKDGFSTFTNKNIEIESKSILEKLHSNKNIWDSKNRYKESASNSFQREFISIFKNGVDEFIQATFNSDYFIFYHTLYKSNRKSKEKLPQGSELWHADGGPGNCMNLMICHTHINKSNGSMKIIPWKESKKLLSKLSYGYKRLIRSDLSKIKDFNNTRMGYRELKCNLLSEYIRQNSSKYFQPESKKEGTIFAFRNNCVHAGGFTEVGAERIVSIFHIYPSKKQTSIEEKFNNFHIKTNPFPSPKELP